MALLAEQAAMFVTFMLGGPGLLSIEEEIMVCESLGSVVAKNVFLLV